VTCRYSHSDGAYVLGALSPPERSEYQAHLSGCGECATAVAGLAPVPGLLGRVDPAALTPGPPPSADRLARLLATVSRQRRQRTRRRRWQLAAVAAAAAVLAVMGSAVFSGLVGAGDGQQRPMAAMAPVAEPVPVTAQVAVAPAAGGTEVWLACQYPPMAEEVSPYTFRLVAVGPGGTREQLGSWWAGPGDEMSMTGLTRFTGTELVRLELHNDTGDVLLVYDVAR